MQDLLQWFKDEKRLHKKYAYKVSGESLFSLLPSSLLPPPSFLSLSFILLPSPSLPVLSMCLFLPSSLQIILSVKKIFEALPTLVDVSIPKVSVTFSSSLFSYLTLFSSPSAPTLAFPSSPSSPSLPPSLPPSVQPVYSVWRYSRTILRSSQHLPTQRPSLRRQPLRILATMTNIMRGDSTQQTRQLAYCGKFVSYLL